MSAPLCTLSLTEALAAIEDDRISGRELVRSCLERIAERDEQVHAWTHLAADAEVAAASAAQGPLRGAPVGVKDLIDTVDMPTSYGSPIYAGHRPVRDASCVTAIHQSGGVILGKTVSTEFACFEPGPTANPHDPTRTPGGSSSGSAAAVADFQVPVALGTQTAGSIIRPASYCGVVGYKPSYGLLDVTGIRPLAPSLDHLGVFARNVADAALLASLLGRRPALATDREAKGAPSIGVCRTYEWEQAEATSQSLLAEAAGRLSAAGAQVADVDLPAPFDRLADAHARIFDYEVTFTAADEVARHRQQVSSRFLERFDAGLAIQPDDYDAARALAYRARAQLDEVFADRDVLLCLSAPGEAPQGLDATGDPIFNRVWSLLGVPCVNVPGLTGTAGMPVGLQVVGRPGDDRPTLQAAAWIHARLAR